MAAARPATAVEKRAASDELRVSYLTSKKDGWMKQGGRIDARRSAPKGAGNIHTIPDGRYTNILNSLCDRTIHMNMNLAQLRNETPGVAHRVHLNNAGAAL